VLPRLSQLKIFRLQKKLWSTITQYKRSICDRSNSCCSAVISGKHLTNTELAVGKVRSVFVQKWNLHQRDWPDERMFWKKQPGVVKVIFILKRRTFYSPEWSISGATALADSSLQKNTQAPRVQKKGTQFRNIFLKNIFHFLVPLNINEYSLQIVRIFLLFRSRALLNVTSVHAGMRPRSLLKDVETTCLLLQKAVSCYKSYLNLRQPLVTT